MKKEEIKACVNDRLKGMEISKGKRQEERCIASKLCTGKASTRAEANRLCKDARLVKQCILNELNGEPLPKGKSREARLERCILKVKCTNIVAGDPERSNPYAVCKASVR